VSRRLRTILTALAAVLLVLVTGSARAADPVVLKIATVAPDGTPWASGLVQYKGMVEKATAGRVTVRPMLGGVLGDENETVIACQRGQIPGVGASTGALAAVVPELNVLELPFLFRSAAEADYILDTVVLETVENAFRARGLVLGFWSENGYRSFGTDYGFVKSPSDLKGHKMRSQESGVHLEMYRAFGASPVPIPVTEVLTSMQTGVVDGYDNTPLFAQAAQWTSATKYYTLTNHVYQPAAIVFNKAWFDALSPADQAILLSARTGLAPQMRKEIRALHPLLVENFAAMDVQVYTPTTAERAAFEPLAKIARDKYLATASAGEKALYAKIVAGLDAYRKSH
jgi:TRAP-type C4-dicarboxylate transport system substrate-binding protein